MSKEWDAVEFWNDAAAKLAPDANPVDFVHNTVRTLAAEAERRGMLKAAGKLGGPFKGDEGLDSFTLAWAIAAIERAAKGEG